MLAATSLERLRRKAGSKLVESFFLGMAAAGKLHPDAKVERHNIELISDVPYLKTNRHEHKLDIYRSTLYEGPRPIVFYVHGGGFRILSKETHWLMGLIFARRGYVVFNINYRLAPEHPFPAAIEDTCAAFEWVVKHADLYSADPSRIVLAGESAGGNLITALTLALCYQRSEPHSKKMWDLNVVPKAVVPACGILQVSDPERFARKTKISRFVNDRIIEVSHAYLPQAIEKDGSAESWPMADPLLVLERGAPPDRALPPFFVPVGTRDPLIDDARRLKLALDKLGVECVDRYYEGEMHAFHALIFRKAARDCWKQKFEFLSKHLEL